MNIVTIGGGSGHAQVLKGLKHIPGLNITAICPSTDSGGSTGYLRRDYGISGYLGDLTKCIAALCPDEQLAKSLLHRFEDGCLEGHSVKNVLFLGLEKTVGLHKALEIMYRLCNLGTHRVIPVTTESTELCALLRIGQHIQGETHIDQIAKNPLWNPNYHAIQEIYLKPRIAASRETLEAIKYADWCVICPGDLYSSILPVILPEGIRDALLNSNASLVIVLNIMTKKGETDKYQAVDFIARIEECIKLPAHFILCNNVGFSGDALFKYALEQKVQLVMPEENTDPRIRMASLATMTKEGFVCHDSDKVAAELAKIFAEKN